MEKSKCSAKQVAFTLSYTGTGGTLIPKVNLGAIRGGAPYRPTVSPELCLLYVDCRTTPNQDVMALKCELEDIIRSARLEGKVELYVFRRGYEANNIERLSQAVGQAHFRIRGEKMQAAIGPECSMWRDINIFNEVGIPAATFGPAVGAGSFGEAFCITLDDLYKTAQIYALTALDICRQDKHVE